MGKSVYLETSVISNSCPEICTPLELLSEDAPDV